MVGTRNEGNTPTRTLGVYEAQVAAWAETHPEYHAMAERIASHINGTVYLGGLTERERISALQQAYGSVEEFARSAGDSITPEISVMGALTPDDIEPALDAAGNATNTVVSAGAEGASAGWAGISQAIYQARKNWPFADDKFTLDNAYEIAFKTVQYRMQLDEKIIVPDAEGTEKYLREAGDWWDVIRATVISWISDKDYETIYNEIVQSRQADRAKNYSELELLEARSGAMYDFISTLEFGAGVDENGERIDPRPVGSYAAADITQINPTNNRLRGVPLTENPSSEMVGQISSRAQEHNPSFFQQVGTFYANNPVLGPLLTIEVTGRAGRGIKALATNGGGRIGNIVRNSPTFQVFNAATKGAASLFTPSAANAPDGGARRPAETTRPTQVDERPAQTTSPPAREHNVRPDDDSLQGDAQEARRQAADARARREAATEMERQQARTEAGGELARGNAPQSDLASGARQANQVVRRTAKPFGFVGRWATFFFGAGSGAAVAAVSGGDTDDIVDGAIDGATPDAVRAAREGNGWETFVSGIDEIPVAGWVFNQGYRPWLRHVGGIEAVAPSDAERVLTSGGALVSRLTHGRTDQPSSTETILSDFTPEEQREIATAIAKLGVMPDECFERRARDCTVDNKQAKGLLSRRGIDVEATRRLLNDDTPSNDAVIFRGGSRAYLTPDGELSITPPNVSGADSATMSPAG